MKGSNQRDALADDKQLILGIFADRLLHWRRVRNLSRKELATKAGISEQIIGAYERGAKTAGIDKVAAIARVLSIRVEDLITIRSLSGDLSEHYHDCEKILKMAKIDSIPSPEEGKIRLFLPPRITRNTHGEFISESIPPVTMDLTTFFTVFGRITDRALASANLSEIILRGYFFLPC